MAAWKNPEKGKGYRGFWSFNHLAVGERPEAEEIHWQLAQMHAKGMREVIVHLRFGHAIPYLSDHWRAMVQAIFQSAEQLGMGIWMWDEDAWPPGYAGGRVTHEHPEFRGRNLSCEVITIEGGIPVELPLPRGEPVKIPGLPCEPHPAHYGFPVAVFAVEKESGEVVDVHGYVGTSAECWTVYDVHGAYLAPSETRESVPYSRANKVLSRYHLHWTPPGGTWDVMVFLINEGRYTYNGWLIDPLNPKAVRAWIDATHEWYWKHFAKYFGPVFKGFYSAEPPHTRWTPGLWEEFKEIKGYDLRPLLPHLRRDIDGRSVRVRMDYQEVHSQLYATHFIRQVRNWCVDHGVQYMGRLSYEEHPSEMVATSGNLLPAIREFTAQSNDLINGLQIGDQENPFISFGANVCFSISRQQGGFAGFECMGPIDWETSAADSRALYDWGVISGAECVWNENMFYSVDGYRKNDCPPSQFYQTPEWEYYGELVRRYDRLATLHQFGADRRAVGLLYPISSFFARQSGFHPDNDGCRKIEGKLIAAHQSLLEAHIPCDIADETLLDTAEAGEDGLLRVGKAAYEVLILAGCTHLPKERCGVLEQFIQRGGCLITEAGQTIRQVETWQNGGQAADWKTELSESVNDPARIGNHAKLKKFRIAPLPSSVMARRWSDSDFEAIAVMNVSRQRVDLDWPEEKDPWEQWSLETGERISQRTLNERELAVFVKTERKGIPEPRTPKKKERVIPLDGEWEFQGLENCLLLKNWCFHVGDDCLEPKNLTACSFIMLSHHGVEPGPALSPAHL